MAFLILAFLRLFNKVRYTKDYITLLHYLSTLFKHNKKAILCMIALITYYHYYHYLAQAPF